VKPVDVFGISTEFGKKKKKKKVDLYQRDMIGQSTCFNRPSTHRAEFEIIEDRAMQDFRTF
jgi:hypothetical protein